MKIKCVSNKGKLLSTETINSNIHYSKDMVLSELILGNEYTVYGISLWEGIIHFMIVPENIKFPSWYPEDFFEIIDSELPPKWQMGKIDIKNANVKFRFVIGYPELIFRDSHIAGLILNDKDELKIFSVNKTIIDSLITEKE